MTDPATVAKELTKAQRECLFAFTGEWEAYLNVNVDVAQDLCEMGLAQYQFDDPEPPHHYYRLTIEGECVRNLLEQPQ